MLLAELEHRMDKLVRNPNLPVETRYLLSSDNLEFISLPSRDQNK